MVILLVRHGETDHNVLGMKGVIGNDAPLNATGQAQARQAGIMCLGYKPVRLYSSPFLRCSQTANIINHVTKADITFTIDLKEFDMGNWAQLRSEETKQLLVVNKAWDYSPEKYTFKVPGGESWENVADRVNRLLSQIIKTHPEDSSVVLVSHNATIRAAVGIMRNQHFKDWFGFRFLNGSVSGFEYSEGKHLELFVNKTK